MHFHQNPWLKIKTVRGLNFLPSLDFWWLKLGQCQLFTLEV